MKNADFDLFGQAAMVATLELSLGIALSLEKFILRMARDLHGHFLILN